MILCHSKRLLKSNLQEIHNFIFDKFIEVKHLFLEPFKCQDSQNQYSNVDATSNVDNHANKNGHFNADKNRDPNDNKCGVSSSQHGNSPFEEILDTIMNIFRYFVINEFSSATMAPTALAMSHHIQITDGKIIKFFYFSFFDVDI